MFILILRWNQVFSLSAGVLLSTRYSCSPASLFHSFQVLTGMLSDPQAHGGTVTTGHFH